MLKSTFNSKIHKLINDYGVPMDFYVLDGVVTDLRGEPLDPFQGATYIFSHTFKSVISFNFTGEELTALGIDPAAVDMTSITLAKYFYDKGLTLDEVYDNVANYRIKYGERVFEAEKAVPLGHWYDGLSRDAVGIKFYFKRKMNE